MRTLLNRIPGCVHRTFVLTACVALLSAGVFPVSDGGHRADYMTDFENDVLREHNLVRSDPEGYVRYLEEWKRLYNGKRREQPGQRPILTVEGTAAVDEAISFLQAAKPVPLLDPSRGLALAAGDHVRDEGRRGWMGHTGSDGSEPGDRANRHGRWYGRVGENIVYGGGDAREFVIRLLVDDGIPERGHRQNLLNPEYRRAGVAFGYHRDYGTMCVITYASEYEEASE